MIFPRLRLPAVLLVSLLFVGCVEDKDYGEEANSLRPQENRQQNVPVNSEANQAEDSAIKLGEIVNIPFEVEQDSLYREEELPQEKGGGKELTAVFRFSSQDGRELRKKLAGVKAPFDAKVDAESWFPAELIAKSTTSGDDTLKGKGYNAESIAKLPYKAGVLVHIEDTDYYVLTLRTQ